MSNGALNEPLFSAAEMEKAAADAEEIQREFCAFSEWLKTPEAEAEFAGIFQELIAEAERFRRECAAGEYALSPAELEQMLADGRLVKCHTVKRGTGND